MAVDFSPQEFKVFLRENIESFRGCKFSVGTHRNEKRFDTMKEFGNHLLKLEQEYNLKCFCLAYYWTEEERFQDIPLVDLPMILKKKLTHILVIPIEDLTPEQRQLRMMQNSGSLD